MGKRGKGKACADTPKEKRARTGDASVSPNSAVRDSDLVDKCLRFFDRMMDTHKTAHKALNFIYSNPLDRMAFFRYMDYSFPATVGVTYAADLEGQVIQLRPWMLPWDVHSGEAGMSELSAQRNLVTLILTNGFESDADTVKCEKLLVLPRNRTIFKAMILPVKGVIAEGLLAAHDLSFVKGWRRSVAMNICMHIVKTLDLLDDFKLHSPAVVASFSTMYAIVGKYKDDASAITASREITLTAMKTRSKPNAFNHRHQLDHLVALGESREKVLEQWSNPKACQ